MKNPILPIILIIGPLAGVSSAATLPRASLRQISASPLGRGETAYVERVSPAVEREEDFGMRLRTKASAAKADGMYAELYVGGALGPLRVADSSALRGYKLRTLDPSEYSVAAGPLFTHDVATGTYTMTASGQTNAIIVTAKDGVAIEEVVITTTFTGEGLMPGEFTCSKSTYDGSVYRWECAWIQATSMIVKNIEVKAMDSGEVKWWNDTLETVFMIHDVLGDYNLKDLRNYLLHYYDGNRGEDWSKYKAVKSVRMNGQAVRFTDDNRYTLSLSATSNLVLQARMNDAVEINIRTNGEAVSYTTFRISAIRNAGTSSPLQMDFTCDIARFNPTNIGVAVCEGLEEGVWLGLPKSDFSVSGVSESGGTTTGTVTVPSGVRGDKRSFKLLYGNAASDVIDIVLHGRVIVKDILILKGTDSKFYQINVSGGTISATEVPL